MAEIRPLKAWRYNSELSKNIDDLASPLFDVVSQKQREALYENEFSSIHLSVPSGENPAENASKKLEEWKQKGIILQDPLPGIYVYYQYFTLPGGSKEYCRKGFICFMRTYDWNENVLLRHENTMPAAVNDRVELLEKTELNVSPTHGLYSDPEFRLEKYMDESMLHPIYETEDYQGVRDVLSVIHDKKVISEFVTMLKPMQIILADGHHRYHSSIHYKNSMKAANPNHTGNEGYNFHLMYFTNGESDDLRILPTHRLVQNLPDFDEAEILKRCEPYFHIKTVDNVYDIHEIILGKKSAFGLLFKENAFKIRLKPDLIDTLEWKFPDSVKELDLTVLHYFFIEKVLGIPGKEQTKSENISFERNFTNCLAKLIKEEAQMALIVKDIPMEQVKNICASGYTLPQKSTYFYPKVICGFLFGSVKENEFQFPHNISF
ncbi:MAG: DUF1015 domain-containing protein [Bacteroidota bacterium]